MIRFNCPHCDRLSEVHEALARLPLICKGCGQPLTVPERSTAPDPPPHPPPTPPPARVNPPPPVAAKPTPPTQPSAPVAIAVVAGESRLPPADRVSSNGVPSAHPNGEALFETPDPLAMLDDAHGAAPATAHLKPRDRRLLGVVVDGIVAILLVAIGIVLGELLARQSSGDVLRNAASGAIYPLMDLLLWLSPSLLLLLIHALLVSRRRSAGSYVKRRAQD